MYNHIQVSYENMINKIAVWAREQSDIIAVFIFGSRAREVQPADEWSDLDIGVITTNVQRYLYGDDWVKGIGNYWVSLLEPTQEQGIMERRVLFEGGLDVDFVIFPLNIIVQVMNNKVSTGSVNTLKKGVRILVDKHGVTEKLTALRGQKISSSLPSKKQYFETINGFLYLFVWILKKLKRGELWPAQECLNGYMQWQLLKMLEWHTHVTRGLDYDTWHKGRFLEKWADPRASEQIKKTFAHYESTDIECSLMEMLDLFRWVAVEVANHLEYEYPFESDRKIIEWKEIFTSKANNNSININMFSVKCDEML